jgi:hypothetical protein
MDTIIENAYRNPAYGLRSEPSLYKYLKPKYPEITHSKIKAWLNNQEIYQTMKPRNNNYQSFIATGPLEQFQIDLIYMPEAWFNNGYKYILACVDVFSKRAALTPLKERDSQTTTNAFKGILNKLGIPKTIYADQGSEFKNADFNKLLKEHDIKIIYALDHAPFVESLNKTIKTRLYKYMAFHQTAKWNNALPLIVDAYNETPHSSTGISPNDINKSNITQARMHMLKRSKSKVYKPINVDDKVRVPVIHKVKKGYKQQWSFETHNVEATEGKGLYKVNGELYPRKELQLINHSTLVKPMSKTKAQEKIISDERKIGKAINSKLLKEIVDNPTREQVIKDIGTKVISYKRGAAPKAKYIL